MDHTHNKLEVSIPNKQMGMMSSISSSPKSPSEISNNPPVLNMEIGEAEQMQQYIMPNQHVGDMEGTWNSLGSQQMSLPSKRRTMGETMLSNSMGQQLSMPNKNVAHMEPYTHKLELPQLASPNKRTVSKSTTPGAQIFPATNKKMARNESVSGKSGTKQLPLKNRTTQMEPSPKAKSASFESVRWKMRDSLASSLNLVAQGQDKSPNEESNSDNVSENPTDSLPSKEASSVDKIKNVQITSQGILTNESLPDEDVSFADSFFVKDELLQGNGLAWAWDLDVDMGETKEEEHISKKPKLVNEDVEQKVRSPKKLAFKIEAELFKLFGGVNKKYREKGRSLLFNLKDHNNPQLRERVMSGDIPPDRLCLMTPEDLASKELSQWRIAKAEELAQMVVLPDSDIDMRRLVKKTHKGEFQVEFERDDGVSVEVSVGTSTLTRVQTENRETDELNGKETGVGEKGSSKNQDISYRLSIPNDGTDLMQGLMVDEFRDAEFLPPIVSLDEFMESLDAEPPFENLPVNGEKSISPLDKDSSESKYEVDGGKMLPPSDKESSEGGYEGIDSDIATKEPVDTMPKKSDKVELKYSVLDMKMKFNEAPIEQNPFPPGAASNGDCVWEGVLQLNMSTLITVVGFFKSGEKISTKDWPISLEIKGRVRLDAFEKFVQGLPMSRSRAVMIVHFALKEGSSENDHSRFGEVVESYVSDERLGFAEAAKGVEIYFCPPNPKLVEIITKNLSKHQSDNLNSPENGLVGMVVLRRAHLNHSALSPNSSHHPKHTAKREQQFTSGKHQDKNTAAGTNLNFPSKQTPLEAPTRVAAIDHDDDDDGDDDIPPGFGPARDEDDLPEFNFSAPPNSSLPNPSIRIPPHGSNSSAPPLDQIRELIQKYGQTENSVDSRNVVGMGIRPWDDEDDDIPEWQLHAPPQQKLLTHQPPVHFGMTMARQPCPRQVAMPLQPPVNIVHGGVGWARQPINFGTQPGGRQYYGGPAVRSGHTCVDRQRDAARRK